MFHIRIDDREVREGLKHLDERRKSLGEVIRKERPVLRAELATYAAMQSGPDGSWPARSPRTEERSQKRAHMLHTTSRERRRSISHGAGRGHAGPRFRSRMSGPLRETQTAKRASSGLLGSLPGGVTVNARKLTLTARSPVPWSEVQNEGGQVGHGAVIQAREFVFMSDPFLDGLEKRVADWIVAGWDA